MRSDVLPPPRADQIARPAPVGDVPVLPATDLVGVHDIEAREMLAARHVVFGASTRGRSHQFNGTARQDEFELVVTAGGVIVAAVADGVGSERFGALGAHVAARRAVWSCLSWLDRDWLPPDRVVRVAMSHARNAVRDLAKGAGEPVSAYASTLIIVVVVPGEDHTRLCASWCGDGMILVWENVLRPLLVDPGEGNSDGPDRVTPVAATDGMWWKTHSRDVLLPGSHWSIALMTDGVSDDFAGRFERLAAALTSVERLDHMLRLMAYRKTGSSDDRSIVLIRPRM